MASSVKHVYEITKIHGNLPEVKAGAYLIQAGHVRKRHEPERLWLFADPSKPVGSDDLIKSITGKHIGEYEKVKHLLGGKEEE